MSGRFQRDGPGHLLHSMAPGEEVSPFWIMGRPETSEFRGLGQEKRGNETMLQCPGRPWLFIAEL